MSFEGMTKREAFERIRELEARLQGVDVHDVELLRQERDAARARVDELEAVAVVLDRVEAEQPTDIDGQLYMIPWAKAIVSACRRVDVGIVREIRAKVLEDAAAKWADANGMMWCSMAARSLRDRATEIREGRA